MPRIRKKELKPQDLSSPDIVTLDLDDENEDLVKEPLIVDIPEPENQVASDEEFDVEEQKEAVESFEKSETEEQKDDEKEEPISASQVPIFDETEMVDDFDIETTYASKEINKFLITAITFVVVLVLVSGAFFFLKDKEPFSLVGESVNEVSSDFVIAPPPSQSSVLQPPVDNEEEVVIKAEKIIAQGDASEKLTKEIQSLNTQLYQKEKEVAVLQDGSQSLARRLEEAEKEKQRVAKNIQMYEEFRKAQAERQKQFEQTVITLKKYYGKPVSKQWILVKADDADVYVKARGTENVIKVSIGDSLMGVGTISSVRQTADGETVVIGSVRVIIKDK